MTLAKRSLTALLFSLLVVFFGSLFSTRASTGENSSSHVTLRGTVTQVFENTNCAATHTCSLKRVVFRSDDYAIGRLLDPYDLHYGTQFYGSYETNTPADLKDYVFVQFVKGCACLSFADQKGNVVSLFATWKHFGDSKSDINHSSFVVDSPDTDPVYYSAPGQERHFAYLWDEQSYDPIIDGNYHSYGFSVPVRPQLFVLDQPGQASVMKIRGGLIVRDVAVSYRTCLYKTRDVPLTVLDTNVNFAKPITCFDWKSSYVYNWKTGIFEHPSAIAPVCSRARSVYTPGKKAITF